MNYRTQAELDAATRSRMNEVQRPVFDQLMATGTWKVNKYLTDFRLGTVCWLEAAKTGNAIIGIGLDGKIERPLKGGTVMFSKKTLKRVY